MKWYGVLPLLFMIGILGGIVYVGINTDKFYEKSPESEAIAIVNNVITLYQKESSDIFEKINNKELNQGKLYPFVIDTDLIVRAHGSNLGIIGDPKYIPKFTNTTPEIIKQNIADVPFMWVEYTHLDKETGEPQLKRSYFVYEDGYIFASGFNLE
jgi:hypothetical protein